LELEGPQLRPEDIGASNIARQQIGRELNSVEVAFHAFGHHFDRTSFCQTRSTFNQKVTVSQNGYKKFSDEIRLANNLLAQPVF
jgi:hypothetical protein